MEQKPKPKIGILTTFSNFKPEYSLCTVVRQQLEALLLHGYEPVLFVLDIFKGDDLVPEGVEVRKIVPRLILEPYSAKQLPDSYKKDVKKAQVAFNENMQDIDVMLAHDIIFINSFLPYNVALRGAINERLGSVKWLHWIHSAPSSRPTLDGSPWDSLFTLPKNSRLVYMNFTDALRAAEMYGTWETEVRTISNPMDVRILYNYHPLTRKLIDRYDLMSADVIDIYPLSTTRMGDAGKQIEKVVWVMSEIKKLGKSIRIVICNAHANAEKEKVAIEQVYQVASEMGIERRELIFTSLFDIPNWEQGVPHEVVRDLFMLSNLFIFPTVSENCPLVLLEAMAGKNLLVLNNNFPALKDFAGNDALYFNFGSLLQTPEFPNGIELYYKDVAKIILQNMRQNKVLGAQAVVRKKFNVDYIFKQQLEPAILEIYYGG